MNLFNSPVRSRGNDLSSRAGKILHHVQDEASDYATHGRDGLQRAGRDLSHFVREQPLEAILIGASVAMMAGVGLVLCRLFIRRAI